MITDAPVNSKNQRNRGGGRERKRWNRIFVMVPAHKIVFHAIETPFLSIGRRGRDPWFTRGRFLAKGNAPPPPHENARGGWTRGFKTRHISRLDKLNEIAWTCSEWRGLMGTTRNYRDVGQDFDAVRQGSNLKVDADTLSLPLASLFSGYFISWGVFELIFGNWYFRGWGVLRGIFKLSSFGNCDFFDLKREISKINIRWLIIRALNYLKIYFFFHSFL